MLSRVWNRMPIIVSSLQRKRSLMAWFMLLSLLLILPAGCGEGSSSSSSPTTQSPSKVKLALNWVPEPEFGGFYAAQVTGAFSRHGLEVEILPGGAGTPSVQMVGAGQVEFAIASADEIIIARSRGIDLVAIYTSFQTCPQGIMVHASRNLNSLAEVFKDGTLAMEIGLPYGKFLQNKYSQPAGTPGVKIVPYQGGVAPFLADKMFAQQCFVFSEPIAARRAGADPKVFLIAESGYDPYTVVLVTRGDLLKSKPQLVQAMVDAVTEGWTAYLDDPDPANDLMSKLNPLMDAQTFTDAAEAQRSLLFNDFTAAQGMGRMQRQRWETLAQQLVDLKIIEKAPVIDDCFVNLPITSTR